MDVLTQVLAYGFILIAAPLLVLLSRPEPDDQKLIELCRRDTTQQNVQRVYDDTHNVTATEAICGVRGVKLSKRTVLKFEMPTTIVKP